MQNLEQEDNLAPEKHPFEPSSLIEYGSFENLTEAGPLAGVGVDGAPAFYS
jgi:hypothetical protein